MNNLVNHSIIIKPENKTIRKMGRSVNKERTSFKGNKQTKKTKVCEQ